MFSFGGLCRGCQISWGNVKRAGVVRLPRMSRSSAAPPRFFRSAGVFAPLAIGLAACSGSVPLGASAGGADGAARPGPEVNASSTSELDGAADTGEGANAARPSGCVPGATPLAARVLASGDFTGLALVGDSVVVTGDGQVERIPLDGGPPTTLASLESAYGLVVAGSEQVRPRHRAPTPRSQRPPSHPTGSVT